MPNDLPLPDDLKSLLEKRDQEDRRAAPRRDENCESILENGSDRRENKNRRKKDRRDDD